MKAAYASGALIVEYGGKKVQYRSRDEMKAIMKEMEDELGIGKKASRKTRLQYNKGIQ